MGVIWSRFRSKLSTKEVLEDIEKKLKSIEEFQQDTRERKKRVVRWLLVVTVIFYILAVLAYLFIGKVKKNQLYFFGGLVIFAVLVWVSTKILQWYYTRKMCRNAKKSVELRKRKQKILEDVMDTETYKVAKEILDKFGEKPVQKPVEVKPPQNQPLQVRQGVGSGPGTELRQRHVESRVIPSRANPVQSQPNFTPTHMSNTPLMKMPQQLQQSAQRPVAMNYGHGPLRPLPRPILPRERSLVDRMMDFFVGDGPNQRNALICRHCGGHNGMALEEEFEFMSYYCCYCFQFNPSRKQRPMGPRLPSPPSKQVANTGPNSPRPSSVEASDAEKRRSESDASERKSTEDDGDPPTDSQSDEDDADVSARDEAVVDDVQSALSSIDEVTPKAEESNDQMDIDPPDDDAAAENDEAETEAISNDETGPGLR